MKAEAVNVKTRKDSGNTVHTNRTACIFPAGTGVVTLYTASVGGAVSFVLISAVALCQVVSLVHASRHARQFAPKLGYK